MAASVERGETPVPTPFEALAELIHDFKEEGRTGQIILHFKGGDAQHAEARFYVPMRVRPLTARKS